MIFKTVLVTGCRGQVGDQLVANLRGKCERLIVTDRNDIGDMPDLIRLDLCDESRVLSFIRAVRPQIILNPAAYTAVDKAEAEPEIADQINARLPGILARETESLNSLIVHYSTDYVFDGSGSHPRIESDETSPLNVYGRTKRDGEKSIMDETSRHLIFRTSWVFSHHGQNFVKAMLKLGAERETIRVVADQIGAPTSASFIAQATVAALQKTLANPRLTGIYHLCSAGETNWHEFALNIFASARQLGKSLTVKHVEPIFTNEYPTPAKRPLNSRLSCGKFDKAFGEARPLWQDSLRDTLKRILS